MMLILSIPLNAQVQYTSAYRSGEGRIERASQAAILVNPVFVQPSVFFSAKTVDIRANRKWWRTTERVLPSPYNPVELPKSILRKDQLKIDEIKRKRNMSLLIDNPELHALGITFAATDLPVKLLE